MSKMMTCEVCKDAGVQTVIPHDEVGVALMREHFAQAHPEVDLTAPERFYQPKNEISDRWYPR